MAAGSLAAACMVVWLISSQDLNAQAPAAADTKSFAGKKAGDQWDGNGLKMKFGWCPAGKFTMGSPKDDKDRFDNEDQVQVTPDPACQPSASTPVMCAGSTRLITPAMTGLLADTA